MRISASIFTIALGAILTFAVHVQTTGFSLHTGGIILMIVGGGALVITLVLLNQRPRTAVRDERIMTQPVTRNEPVLRNEPVSTAVQEPRYYDDPRV